MGGILFGVIQGCILRPILLTIFLIVLVLVVVQDIDFASYVDDNNIHVAGKNRDDLLILSLQESSKKPFK